MRNGTVTKSTGRVVITCQPTMKREKTSIMNATYTNPDQVRQYVKSATQTLFGAGAVKFRFTRSPARTTVPGRDGSSVATASHRTG
jgi:hypothetical protein